jgi:hypothetical protein
MGRLATDSTPRRLDAAVEPAAPPAAASRRRPEPAPAAVWVLADDKLGHTTQSLGLADALGWPYEVKELRFNRLNRLSNRLLGAGLLGLDRRRSTPLSPPWPALVIGTGRRTVPVARWIGARSGGRTRLVQLGRKGADRADDFDLTVTCAHYGLPPHPRRVETLAPLAAITDQRVQASAERWRDLFGAAPRPHIALLVGGTSALHGLDAATAARMASEVSACVAAAGGTLYVVTSPRTGASAVDGLRAGLRAGDRLYRWRAGDPDNPYLGCLAVADVLVVTGDSESMLAEAAATAVPLYIYPLPARRGALRQRMRAWVGAQARQRDEASAAGPARRALTWSCARLLEHGVVRAPRDLAAMHRALIDGGFARRFGAPLDPAPRPPLCELERVAARVRALFVDGATGAAADRG